MLYNRSTLKKEQFIDNITLIAMTFTPMMSLFSPQLYVKPTKWPAFIPMYRVPLLLCSVAVSTVVGGRVSLFELISPFPVCGRRSSNWTFLEEMTVSSGPIIVSAGCRTTVLWKCMAFLKHRVSERFAVQRYLQHRFRLLLHSVTPAVFVSVRKVCYFLVAETEKLKWIRNTLSCSELLYALCYIT